MLMLVCCKITKSDRFWSLTPLDFVATNNLLQKNNLLHIFWFYKNIYKIFERIANPYLVTIWINDRATCIQQKLNC